MDNLSVHTVHTSKWVRELIESRGCHLWLLPSYSPDFNPIEEAFSKEEAFSLLQSEEPPEEDEGEDARGLL
jgi:hypothetical protein